MEFKAIETQYKGYRFRSRLEARWAVFFEEYGVEWEYEVEGFELSNGARYLPDFRLKTMSTFFPFIFVEIKPFSSVDIEKADKFYRETGQHIVVLFGDPMNYFPSSGNKFFSPEGPNPNYGLGERNDPLGLFYLLGLDSLERIQAFEHFETSILMSHMAAKKARSARFEFGEAG